MLYFLFELLCLIVIERKLIMDKIDVNKLPLEEYREIFSLVGYQDTLELIEETKGHKELEKLIYEMRMCNTTCYLNFLQNQIKAKKFSEEYLIKIPYWEVYRKSNGEFSGLRKNGSFLNVE